MPVLITDKKAVEQSTLIITVSFTDEDGNDVTPNAIAWTWSDEDGDVINDREDVEVGSPAASIDVVLSGDDLQILATETEDEVKRIFTIEADYDSNAGSGLPLVESAHILLQNLRTIS